MVAYRKEPKDKCTLDFAIVVPDGLAKRFCDYYLCREPRGSVAALRDWLKFNDDSVQVSLKGWYTPSPSVLFNFVNIVRNISSCWSSIRSICQ